MVSGILRSWKPDLILRFYLLCPLAAGIVIFIWFSRSYELSSWWTRTREGCLLQGSLAWWGSIGGSILELKYRTGRDRVLYAALLIWFYADVRWNKPTPPPAGGEFIIRWIQDTGIACIQQHPVEVFRSIYRSIGVGNIDHSNPVSTLIGARPVIQIEEDLSIQKPLSGKISSLNSFCGINSRTFDIRQLNPSKLWDIYGTSIHNISHNACGLIRKGKCQYGQRYCQYQCE